MTNLRFNFRHFSLLTLFFASLFFTSCEQEEIQTQTPKVEIQKVKNERLALAKQLSIQIAEHPEFGQTLKSICLAEKENGYYETEFFFNVEKDKSTERFNGNSLDAMLSSSRDVSLRKTMDYLEKNDPGLAILMIGAENATTFNTKVYVDNGFDESDPLAQIQYYENGVLGTHLISKEPRATTFVVRESEAFLSPEELLIANSEDVTRIATVAGNEINVFGYNTTLESISNEEMDAIQRNQVNTRGWCQRNHVPGKDELAYLKTSYDHESIWHGTGEFIIDIFFADNGSSVNTLRARYVGIKENQWYILHKKIITWTATTDLDRMKYRIMEDDGGQTYTLDVAVSGEMYGVPVSGSIGVKYTDDDDFVGEAIVEYCDPIWNYEDCYHTAGSVTFAVRQH